MYVQLFNKISKIKTNLMSCHPNKIVRVTYPKDCCPEVKDSKQLLYNGPALSCINVQTNNPLDDVFKKINDLFCKSCNFNGGTITVGACTFGTVNITIFSSTTI